MVEFGDAMIATGRFRSRSDVTRHAYQRMMQEEGYTPKQDNGGSRQDIDRIAEQVRALQLQYRSMSITKTQLVERSKNKLEWLSKRYPALMKMSTNDFIDACCADSLTAEVPE